MSIYGRLRLESVRILIYRFTQHDAMAETVCLTRLHSRLRINLAILLQTKLHQIPQLFVFLCKAVIQIFEAP